MNQLNSEYKFKDKLGEGGMATVFLAESLKFSTDVAIKILNHDLIKNNHIRSRFIAEARNMFRMSHPNIVRVTDLIDEEGCVAIIMEYIQGETLKEYLMSRGKLNNEEIIALFLQMCEALCYVHNQGFIHRDIKPSNFMVCADKQIKLLDFGIAKNTDMASAEYTQTGTSMILGTPMYMSPEQILSTKIVNKQSDIYSLGVVLWEMIQGTKPYDTKTLSTFELQTLIVNENLPATQTVWDSIISKAMHKKASNRYQKVEAVLDDLSKLNDLYKNIYVENIQESKGLNKLSSKSDTINQATIGPHEKKVQNFSKNSPKKYFPVFLIVSALTFLIYSLYKIKLSTDAIIDIESNMIYIEQGSFYMGCSDYYSNDFYYGDCQKDEKPRHKVYLNSYYIGKYEITQSQWQAIMGYNPSIHSNCNQCPVENITFSEIEEFLEKLRIQTGKNFRLPTEAEWEYAAKDGDRNTITSVSLDSYAWFKENSEDQTHEVGLKRRTELGVYDIIGNVREWCSDWYDKDYYKISIENNPKGPENSPINAVVLRGASFASSKKKCSTTNRGYFIPEDGGNEWNGLRVVHDIKSYKNIE